MPLFGVWLTRSLHIACLSNLRQPSDSSKKVWIFARKEYYALVLLQYVVCYTSFLPAYLVPIIYEASQKDVIFMTGRNKNYE
jgi:hypothetical protein